MHLADKFQKQTTRKSHSQLTQRHLLREKKIGIGHSYNFSGGTHKFQAAPPAQFCYLLYILKQYFQEYIMKAELQVHRGICAPKISAQIILMKSHSILQNTPSHSTTSTVYWLTTENRTTNQKA